MFQGSYKLRKYIRKQIAQNSTRKTSKPYIKYFKKHAETIFQQFLIFSSDILPRDRFRFEVKSSSKLNSTFIRFCDFRIKGPTLKFQRKRNDILRMYVNRQNGPKNRARA